MGTKQSLVVGELIPGVVQDCCVGVTVFCAVDLESLCDVSLMIVLWHMGAMCCDGTREQTHVLTAHDGTMKVIWFEPVADMYCCCTNGIKVLLS